MFFAESLLIYEENAPFHIDAINLKILRLNTYVNVKIFLPLNTIIISNYFNGMRGSQKLFET